MDLKEYKTSNGEILLYKGNPDLSMLDELVKGPGDIWHSGLDQGLRDAFPEIIYQTSIFWFYLNDFKDLDKCVSWRIHPEAFVIRSSLWERLGGFEEVYDSKYLQAFSIGINLLKNNAGIPIYIKGLFKKQQIDRITISALDRYLFFKKNFKKRHSIYMLLSRFLSNGFTELNAYLKARKKITFKREHFILPPRNLREISGNPKVSYIIPTMYRQDYTLQLLEDLSKQTFLPTQVIIVDATPVSERDESLYSVKNFPFELEIIWQTSKGSCRARNEAIAVSTGDFIVFGDDDIRIQSQFIENHIRLLQTYNADACNGLDIMATHHTQGLKDLEERLDTLGENRFRVGATASFSNANSCVRKEWVDRIMGNDINFDGGYGEDTDFGIRLLKAGAVVLYNPFSVNLHLKPPSGGYRFWGIQASIIGKKRKKQPWEMNYPVKHIKPVPSPTIMYYNLKHFKPEQLIEYKKKHFFIYLLKGGSKKMIFRFFRIPYKLLQYKRSKFYAKKLIELGPRYN